MHVRVQCICKSGGFAKTAEFPRGLGAIAAAHNRQLTHWWVCPIHPTGWPEQVNFMYRNQDRSNKSEPTQRQQKQPRDRGFNPRDWEGSSGAALVSSQRQRPQQQPEANLAEPSSRAERTAAGSLDGKKPDAAGVPGLDNEASLDDWEPTGAGRKGWYNPQSSPSSAPASKGTHSVNDAALNSASNNEEWRRRQEGPQAYRGEPINIAYSQVVCRGSAHITHGLAPADASSQEGSGHPGIVLKALKPTALSPLASALSCVRMSRFITVNTA